MNASNPIEAAGRTHIAGEATAYAAFTAAKLHARDTIKGDFFEIFQRRFPNSAYLDTIRKAAIPPGTMTGWGQPIAAAANLASGFLAYLRPRTVIGRMTGFRRVPLNVRVARAIGGTSVAWVGEGKPTPLSAMVLDALTLPPAKIGGIVVITRELAKSSDPDAATLIRDDLAGACVEFSDRAFLDPTAAGVAGVSPASITYGAPNIVSTGDFATDFAALVAAITTPLTAPYVVMQPHLAVALAGLNIPLTKNAGINGDIGGIPILASASAPAGTIVLIDASEVMLAQGPIEIDTSAETSLEMQNPATDPPTAATVQISLFHENLFACRSIEFTNWQRGRDGAVAYLSAVAIPVTARDGGGTERRRS